MDEKTLNGIERTAIYELEPGDISAMANEVRRLWADVALMATDSGQHLAGQEAGRLEAIRWAMAGKKPNRNSRGGFRWWNDGARPPRVKGVLADEEDLPAEIFDLLESGELEVQRLEIIYRDYPDEASAMADKEQAMIRLARKGFWSLAEARQR